jgi:branched-chain amino acid transport system permease protein
MAAIAFFYQFIDNFAFLVLCAVGLAIIFGMMGVINLAHGEFIMVGAYATAVAAHAGVFLPVAMACGVLAAAILGIVLERLIIRRLYGRPLDSIIATWAISLILSQGMLVLAGPTMPGIPTPLGSFAIGSLTFSVYRIVLAGVALCVLAALYYLFTHTRYGVYARATIQVPDMACALGLDTGTVYSATFGIGAGLAGLAGALYAPTMTLAPTMGGGFVVPAFITVIVGGGDVLVGTAPAAGILSIVQSVLTSKYGTLIGQVGLLLAVILTIRILPKGISEWMSRRGSRV